MNKKILLTLALAGLMAGVTSCGGGATTSSSSNKSSSEPTTSDNGASSSQSTSEKESSVYEPDLTDKVTLNLSVNYSETNTGMKYDLTTDYTTPKGTKIKSGDWKPVWSTLQSELNFTINDVTVAGKKSVTAFKENWTTTQYADMACGNVSDMVDFSVKGDNETILDISEYLDYMPNFSKFLDENPIVRMSITTSKHGNSEETGIYYLPYFDGMSDLEKMTLLRADYVRKLLDTDYDSVEWDTTTGLLKTMSYQPTVADDSYTVEVPESMTSDKTKTITKASGVKNIITQQNELAENERTSQVMVKQFRDYIKAKYGTQYSTLSDLFLGVDASYDADEMIALMRIVKVSPYALTGNASTVMVPFVPREYNNQRCEDLFRWGAQLFGVRGLESRCSYLYIDSTGKIRDARGQSETVTLIDNLNKLYNEGLILENYTSDSGYGVTNGKWAESIVVGGNTNYSGFMEYDYSQTQGVWNDKEGSKNIKGYDFRPIIGGVAKWDDGDSSTNYFQFTESWRSVKTQGWCLNASLKNDQAKLLRALAVADYFYSDAGQQLNSFGPESEGYTEGTIDYQGRTVAKFTDKALEQLNDSNIGKGSYTDYLRKYVGATLPVGYVKEQGMEYQCTSENSKNGLSIINKALELGTFKHVECSLTENPFYTVVPSAFNLDASQVSTKSDAETSSKLGSINSNGSSTSWNIWNNYVIYGFGGKKGDTTLETKDEYLEMVKNWGVASLETIYNDAYYLMTLDYKN